MRRARNRVDFVQDFGVADDNGIQLVARLLPSPMRDEIKHFFPLGEALQSERMSGGGEYSNLGLTSGAHGELSFIACFVGNDHCVAGAQEH